MNDRRPSGRWILPGLLCLLAGGWLAAQSPDATENRPDHRIYILEIEGAIGPATRDYVVRGIEQAEDEGAAAVVLRMDTPGGLVDSTRDIIRRILNADVPVITWVAPPGAHAASAGTYIHYSAHVAAMAPSTNLGAATPVPLGGIASPGPTDESDEDNGESESSQPAAGEAKAVEDAVAYIRGLAERHGRNAEWAERAVREAVSLTASEALEQNVADLIAEDIASLLEQLDGREVVVGGATVVLAAAGAGVEEIKPDWRSEFLGVITNPMLAMLLLMIGLYGLLLEGYNPGGMVPGVIGAVCLLLALYALQVLPVNYAGLGLIILGTLLILAELFVPSFGILGIGGVVAAVMGAIILYDTDVPGIAPPRGLIAGVAAAASAAFFGVMYLVVRAQRRPRAIGVETLVGAEAEAVDTFVDGRGRVHIDGEDWSGRSAQPVARGDKVRIARVDGLVLEVEPELKGE